MPDPTIRERIVRELVRLLNEPSKPAHLTVHRNLGRPVQSDDCPALVVAITPGDGAESTQRMDHWDGLERTLRLTAEIRTAGADVETLHADTDEIYAWVVTQIGASRAAGLEAGTGPLGGLCEDIREVGLAYGIADHDQTYQALGVILEVTYWTSETDPREPPEVPA
jgi:hypothetical protein